MSEATPTRAVVLELREEQRAMHEGYAFLDEKCLLLAGEILRELDIHAGLERTMLETHDAAVKALQAAVARHGVEELQVHPPLDQAGATIERHARSIMGVPLLDVSWQPARARAAPSVRPSPEAETCRRAFVELIVASARLAGVNGNLERLSLEYRRSVRRARALQDVLLPEVDQAVNRIEARLEELEQEDAIMMRGRA